MSEILDLLKIEIFNLGNFIFTIGHLVNIAITILITLVLLRIAKKLLFRKYIHKRIDEGNIYSLFQIIKYLAWIISILLILDSVGIKLNALLAGSAALLVGIGLGLQNTFNNFIAGIILLFEGSIKVGDILEIDDDIVKILRIGLRTSNAINRDDISLIIPNSLITANKVVNWSHQRKDTRFRIGVSVAYGSDVDLVIKILKESAAEHLEITDKDSIIVRFTEFGNSSLNFELLFFSPNIFRIENVKSDLRIIINRKFIENGIIIPFPQLDLHIKKH